jgi:hypothetical protein
MERVRHSFNNLLFVGIVLASLILAVGGIFSGMEKRAALMSSGGARKVDIDNVRKQISTGSLSPAKARFYRKLMSE